MKPLGVSSKYDLAATSKPLVARRAKAGRSRARQAAKAEIARIQGLSSGEGPREFVRSPSGRG